MSNIINYFKSEDFKLLFLIIILTVIIIDFVISSTYVYVIFNSRLAIVERQWENINYISRFLLWITTWG